MSADPAEIWVSRGRMGGQPCVYGHRLTTESIAAIADERGADAVLDLYPHLTTEQVEAAIWYERNYGQEPDETTRTLGSLTAADLGSDVTVRDGGSTHVGSLGIANHQSGNRTTIFLRDGDWVHNHTYPSDTPCEVTA